jgi:integrase
LGGAEKKIAGSGRARRVPEGGLAALLVAGEVDARWLVFVDEMGTNVSLCPLYAWSPKGERAFGSAPRNWGKNVTLLASLRSHLERQLGEIDRAGDMWRENGLIFASEVGEPLDRRLITTHRFKPLLKGAGLPQIRFHDLRHTCATLLLSKNVNPKIVSEMLGHATIAITLDTYSHVLPTMQESAAKAMEDALS